MSDILSSVPTSSADRLGVTALFALIVHGVLILGVTFDFPMPRPALPSLDVTLVQTANREKPDKADFLAQADNRGGGNSDKALRPSQRTSSPLAKADPGEATHRLDQSSPQAQDASGPEVLASRAHSEQKTTSEPEHRQQTHRDVKPAPVEIRHRMEMARLAAEVRDDEQQYAKRPKVKYLSANTREYAYAAYMRGWVARVSRIGNLNYPEQARKRDLHGDLILTVVLRRDGSVKSAEVIQSSGHQLLDDAALRIVHLSAPFPPIPHKAGNFDEFNITRTWQFLPGGNLRTRG